MQDRPLVAGVLGLLGLGTGATVANTLSHVASIVDVFGKIGTIGGGVIAAGGVVGLAYKMMKVLNRVDTCTQFVSDQLLTDAPGTLRRDIREAKEFVNEVRDLAHTVNERGATNEKKLDQVIGHTRANKLFAKELHDLEGQMLNKVDKIAEKVEAIKPDEGKR